MSRPPWFDWAQRLQAIAQIGLTYSKDPFDLERFAQVREIAAEIMAAGVPDMTLDAVRGLFAEQAGYATPKVDVRGVVFHEDKVLLVREERDQRRWTLPGGWADVGEPPALATEREVWEEAGYRVKAAKLLALYDRDTQGHPPIAFSVYKAFFLCDLLDTHQDLLPNVETQETDWFSEDTLPDDLSIGRVTRAQLLRFFMHHRQPNLPTDFD